jgi:molybdopterin-binding protein
MAVITRYALDEHVVHVGETAMALVKTTEATVIKD